jgi:putative ABC transport system permease protein
LLRARGASLAQLQRLATAEAATVAAIGAAVGLVLAAVVGRVAFGSSTLGATTGAAVLWAIGSVLFGAVIALATVAVPARREAATVSVAANRRVVGRATRPLALRYGLDIALLVAAALVFWATSRNGYNLVLAPEGVPTVSVNYWALAGPLLLWVGTGLFAWRVADTLLGRGRGLVRRLLRPVAGPLASPVASTLRRQRHGLASAIVLVALTGAFAISTSVFNATFRQQVGVDALLTNGASVTVTKSPGARTAPDEARRLAAVPGVGHIEPLQHRYVYVGNDLQDLFGVDPLTIGAAGKLQDAYFTGGSASQVLQRLTSSPDAVLVSDETVKDFQLHLGDALHLRIRDARTGNLVPVAFTYAGVAKEFPTAPKDSFLIGNASYIATQTGNPAPDAFLISTNGSATPPTVAARVRQVAAPGEVVTDIDSSRRVVGSSLTAVDLAGLTRVELGYALVLAAAATGLVLALGFAQRRRTFVITSALGARPKQVAAFARSEAWVLGVLGGVLGVVGGWLLANMLVKVLTRVFDPPPAHLAVPWAYLSVVLAIGAAAIVAASRLAVRASQRPAVEALRDL